MSHSPCDIAVTVPSEFTDAIFSFVDLNVIFESVASSGITFACILYFSPTNIFKFSFDIIISETGTYTVI